MLPLGRNRSWGLRAPGAVYRDSHEMAALVRIVTPGYLEAMGMRLREGRAFSWNDAASGEAVVIINEAAARRHWPEGSPLGRTAEVTLGGWKPARIIGIVADVRGKTIETSTDPEMYLPAWLGGPSGAELVIRSSLPIASLAPSVVQTLRDLNPNQPATPLRPLQDLVDRAVSPRRFFLLLVGSLASLGLALAALGIFGVISYAVKQRTREIGVRMALGASASQVRRQILLKSVRLAGLGLCAGTLAAYVMARMITSLLFGTTPGDPVIYAVVPRWWWHSRRWPATSRRARRRGSSRWPRSAARDIVRPHAGEIGRSQRTPSLACTTRVFDSSSNARWRRSVKSVKSASIQKIWKMSESCLTTACPSVIGAPLSCTTNSPYRRLPNVCPDRHSARIV